MSSTPGPPSRRGGGSLTRFLPGQGFEEITCDVVCCGWYVVGYGFALVAVCSNGVNNPTPWDQTLLNKSGFGASWIHLGSRVVPRMLLVWLHWFHWLRWVENIIQVFFRGEFPQIEHGTKSTSGSKSGAGALWKRSLGAVLKTHGKSRTLQSEDARFFIA